MYTDDRLRRLKVENRAEPTSVLLHPIVRREMREPEEA
jgi:hypothetical protein